MKKENGFTFLGFLMALTMVVVIGMLLIRFVPVYFQQFAVSSSLKSLNENTGVAINDEKDLRRLLNKRLTINEVRDLEEDDINIDRQGDAYKVNVAYEKRVKLIGNLYATVSYDEAVEISP